MFRNGEAGKTCLFVGTPSLERKFSEWFTDEAQA
jgi:hypothetical protein